MRLIDADLIEAEYIKSMSEDTHHTAAASLIHQQEHNHILHILEKAPTIDAVTEERCKEIAMEMIPSFIVQAKAEAYKEIIEKLKSKLYICDDNFNPVVTEKEIDDTFKEMAGETE